MKCQYPDQPPHNQHGEMPDLFVTTLLFFALTIAHPAQAQAAENVIRLSLPQSWSAEPLGKQSWAQAEARQSQSEQLLLPQLQNNAADLSDIATAFTQAVPQKAKESSGNDEKNALPSRRISVPPETLIETIIIPEDDFWLRMHAGETDLEPPARPAQNVVSETPPVSAQAHKASSVPSAPVASPVPSAPVVPATVSPAPKVAEAPVPATKPAETKVVEAPPVIVANEAPEGLKILTLHMPTYTVEARGENIEGEVVLSVLFRQDGWIKEIEVLKGLGHGLDERAIAAVKRTFYESPRQNGQPVDVRAQVTYHFTLDKVTGQVTKLVPAKGSQP